MNWRNGAFNVWFKTSIWQVECDLVHNLVLVGFNKSCPGILWCYFYSGGIRQVSCGMQPSNSIDSCIVKSCSCQVLEISLWFLCDGRVIIFFGCELHSWQLGADVGVSCGFLCIRREEPLKFEVIFRYLVGPFVRFLSSVEEPEAASLFLFEPNGIHLLYHTAGHG